MKNQYDLPCNIAQTLNLIGDKWTLLIIHAIRTGQCTYKEIQLALEGIPTNLLSNRLKSLEEDGLIRSVLYQDHPPRYRYELKQSAEDLDDVFYALILWGESHLRRCYKQLTHKDCGHGVEIRYYCEDCDKVVSKGDLIVRSMTQNDES